MSALARLYRRFLASTRGIAAVEFGIMLPVLVLMFLASIDAGRAIAIYMKVRAATYALDAITNQYTTIEAADMQAILGATSVILQPYSSSPVQVVITQVAISGNGTATVNWSTSLNASALAVGEAVTVPSSFATPNSYVILGQVSYTYTPLFIYFIKNAITLSDSLFVTPRSSTCVIYAPVTSSC